MKTVRSSEFLAEIACRRQLLLENEPAVKSILERVQSGGDREVAALTAQYDGASLPPDGLLVQNSEIEQAYNLISPDLLAALEVAMANIQRFHAQQLRNSWFETRADGSLLGQRFSPIPRVGLYVPGGTAVYPSSVLMSAIPAQVAGVPELVICTPPRADGTVNPSVLVAADRLGIRTIYKAGGAQAIAAMAFGTKTLPAVDKIVGPGNIFVTTAKRLVYGYVDIDMLAGPSEIMILADDSADPRLLAADLLSQAEHDQLAQAVLVTTSAELAKQTAEELNRQLPALPRASLAAAALAANGRIVLVDDLAQAAALANRFAPEHLELLVKDPLALLGLVQHAGAIFLGPYSPEPLGDYTAGPSHVLPTGGTARFASGLTVDSFRKSSSIIAISPAGFFSICEPAATLARLEGLEAHANSIKVRYELHAKSRQPSGNAAGPWH